MEEVWKDVIGYEGRYQVSNLGRVKSLAYRKVNDNGKTYNYPERLIGQDLTAIENKRSPKVGLSTNGKVDFKQVTHLVLETFVGPRPPGTHVVWLDGDRANNKASNLTWGNIETIKALKAARPKDDIPDYLVLSPKKQARVDAKTKNQEAVKAARREIAHEVLLDFLSAFIGDHVRPLIANELDEIMDRIERLNCEVENLT